MVPGRNPFMDPVSRLKEKARMNDLDPGELCSYLRIVMAEDYGAYSALSRLAASTADPSLSSALAKMAGDRKEAAETAWVMIERIELTEEARLGRAMSMGWGRPGTV
jgi:hypothetical protein